MGAGRGRRTGVILIVLILIVVIIAAMALFVLQGLGGGGRGTTASEPPTAPPPTPPPVVNIIVAARDIPRGARLTVQDVTVMPWPLLDVAPLPTDALTVSGEVGGAGLDQVEGRIARVDILKGQPVLNFMLTAGEEPTGLGDVGSDAALRIPSGMVAITVPITRTSLVGYALREGDHVDILMSFRFIDVDEEFQTPLPNQAIYLTDSPELSALGFNLMEMTQGREDRGLFGTTLIIVPNQNGITSGEPIVRQTTQLVIDNAIVMHVGLWPLTDLAQPIVITPAPPPTAPPEGEPTPEGGGATPVPEIPVPDLVTLAMTRQDVLVLKYAIETGASIDLVLRSALDDDINDIVTDPVTLDYIINAYNVTPPNKLPVALDPRVDLLNQLLQSGGAIPASGTTSPTEGSTND